MTDIHTIGTGDMVHVQRDGDMVSVHAESAEADCPLELTPREARALAVALLQAADELD